MRKIIFAVICTLFCGMISAQTAKSILDKTAALINDKNGVTVTFSLSGQELASTNGTIHIKGKKFHTTMNSIMVWFDGKTQWTYSKQTNEVNVNNPSDEELQMLNPYNFIYMYRDGYNATLTKQSKDYQVHLTANDKKKNIQEMNIAINRSTNMPSKIEIKQGKKWYTIVITDFKQSKLNDTIFQFRQKDFPQAEVIDLR